MTTQLKFNPTKEDKENFQKACLQKNVSMNNTLIKFIKSFSNKNLKVK